MCLAWCRAPTRRRCAVMLGWCMRAGGRLHPVSRPLPTCPAIPYLAVSSRAMAVVRQTGMLYSLRHKPSLDFPLVFIVAIPAPPAVAGPHQGAAPSCGGGRAICADSRQEVTHWAPPPPSHQGPVYIRCVAGKGVGSMHPCSAPYAVADH